MAAVKGSLLVTAEGMELVHVADDSRDQAVGDFHRMGQTILAIGNGIVIQALAGFSLRPNTLKYQSEDTPVATII